MAMTIRRTATLPTTAPTITVVVFADSAAIDVASIIVLGVGVELGELVSDGDILGEVVLLGEGVGVLDEEGKKLDVTDGVGDGVTEGAAFRLNWAEVAV